MNILIDANANSETPTTSKVGYILYNSFSFVSELTLKCGNVFSNKFNAGDYYATLTTSNSNSFNNPWRNYFFYGANYGTADNFKEISLPSGEVNTNVVGKNFFIPIGEQPPCTYPVSGNNSFDLILHLILSFYLGLIFLIHCRKLK